MDAQAEQDQSLEEVVALVSDELNADVIHCNGSILRHADKLLITECITRRKRANVLLVLVTTGGDADAAYRVARCLQSKYKRFFLYVSGYCKSAGTLVASGAHELIMSDHGELGPMDVQMSKKDELWEVQSGLTVMDTLSALQDNALNAFERIFLAIKFKSGGSITLKTATQIATQMTTGLFSPLYSQVDPLHIGEAGRAMSIAGKYGRRLLLEGQNIEPDALDYLMSEYPSHGFVIDRKEARGLFRNVRGPSEMEILLAEKLGERARWPDNMGMDEPASFTFLSTELPADDVTEAGEEMEDNDADSEDSAGPRSRQIAGATRAKFERGNGEEDAIA